MQDGEDGIVSELVNFGCASRKVILLGIANGNFVTTINNGDAAIHRNIDARLIKQISELLGFQKTVADIDEGGSGDATLLDLSQEAYGLNICTSVASKLVCHESGNLAPELGLSALSGIQGQNCNFQHNHQFTGQGSWQVQ
jgi:hypothetical protein